MVRQRDELWETLIDVCGADTNEMTRSERGRYNFALKQLREVGATPKDIRDRAGRYRSKYPDIDVTPTALVSHWSSLKRPQQRSVPPSQLDHLVTAPEPSDQERAANKQRIAEMVRSIGGEVT